MSYWGKEKLGSNLNVRKISPNLNHTIFSRQMFKLSCTQTAEQRNSDQNFFRTFVYRPTNMLTPWILQAHKIDALLKGGFLNMDSSLASYKCINEKRALFHF